MIYVILLVLSLFNGTLTYVLTDNLGWPGGIMGTIIAVTSGFVWGVWASKRVV